MAETNDTEATETDIFQQQKQTIDLLYEVLQRQSADSGQPTYVTPIERSAATPNYMLYIGIGAALVWFLKG